MSRVQDRENMPSGAERIRQAARRKPKEKLTALLHHLTPETLGAAYDALKREAAPGVDGMSWEEYGQGRDERLRDLHERVHRGAYRAKPVRRVNIPKPDGGERALGVAALEDKILQRAMVDNILTPIYETEFIGFSYGFRPGRGAHDALDALAYGIMRRKINWIVDADIRQYFGEIPHCDLIRSIARRVSDGRMLGWIKMWLEMAVVEDDGKGGKRRTNRARRERKGTPQGAPISPLLRNVYMRRFILGWKQSGHARRYGAEIVNYADDFVVCGKAPAEAMRAIVERMMEQLRLPVNATKTRCLRCPDEPMEFLGYRIGRNHSPRTGRASIGTRPSKASVRSICRRISEPTEARYGLLEPERVVERLNRAMLGWANYFRLGPVSPAYRAVDAHATKRLRQWLCRKHKVRSGQYVRYPDTRLWDDLGRTRLAMRTASRPWAKA